MKTERTITGDGGKRRFYTLILLAAAAIVFSSFKGTAYAAAPYVYGGVDYTAEFMPSVDFSNYPDLQTAVGPNEALLLAPYATFGKAEGRNAVTLFEGKTYYDISSGVALPIGFGNPGESPLTSELSGIYAAQVVELTNANRALLGLPPLTYNEQLSTAATKRAQEMTDLGYFAHKRPDGSKPSTVMKEYGLSWSYFGENLGRGQSTPEQVVNDWIGSESHRANILNEKYTQIGVGIVWLPGTTDRYMWVQLFRKL